MTKPMIAFGKICFSAAICLLLFLFARSPLAAVEETTPETDKQDFGISEEAATFEKRLVFDDLTENEDDRNAAKLAEEGLFDGRDEPLFAPEEPITQREFVKTLLRAVGVTTAQPPRSGYFLGDPDRYYLALAAEHQYLDMRTFRPDDPLSHEEMVKMGVRVLGLGTDPTLKSPFADVNDQFLTAAFHAYLDRGSHSEIAVLFEPSRTVTKREAADFLVRLQTYREDPYAVTRGEILKNATENRLSDENELLDFFFVLNRELMTEFTFSSDLSPEEWSKIYLHAGVLETEYFYSTGFSCRYYPDSPIYTITLHYETGRADLETIRDSADLAAKKILEDLLVPGMSEAQTVKAIHDYVILHCAYDLENYEEGTIPYLSRTAYGALVEGKAVCQGYCAAFDLLCRHAGISSISVTGTAPGSDEMHAWNAVMIGGRIYYLDLTHDDPVPDRTGYVSHKYYILTEEQMRSLGYVWDNRTADEVYFRR